MICNAIALICIVVAVLFFIVYGIYTAKPELIIKDYVPSSVSLPDGSIVVITDYPKVTAPHDFDEKGISENDMLICDPETSPKIHVHDVVIANNGNVYVVDTCHKDGTYTLKRPGEKLERQHRDTIKYVARYLIRQPFDDIVDEIF